MNKIISFLCMAGLIWGVAACKYDKSSDEPLPTAPLYQVAKAAQGAVKDGLVGVVFAEVDTQKISGAAAGLKRLSPEAAFLEVDSYMGLGSNGKSLTAMLAASMVEDGLLGWDSTLADLLPELADVIPPINRTIKFEELLNHRSGLLPLLNADEAATFDWTALPDSSQARRLLAAQWILSQEPATDRGELLYSNAGYIVAGVIMERIGGEDFNRLLKDRILDPLGLRVGTAAPAAQDSTQPFGHMGNSKEGIEVLDPADPIDELINELFVATGTLSMNQESYGRYLQWHLKAFKGESTPIPFSYIDRLKSLEEKDYALGWYRGVINNEDVLFHSGSTSGFESLVVVELSGSRAVFAVTNTASDSWTMDVLNKWMC